MCLNYVYYIYTYIGVYISLMQAVYANNSLIPITEIGETNTTSNTGLQCITDKRPCCQNMSNRAGEWYFPDGNTVPGPLGNPTTFYRNRGDDGTVNLNRVNTRVMSPTGLFCCKVPSTLEPNVIACVYTGEDYSTLVHTPLIIVAASNLSSLTVNILIMPIGSTTAGEAYTLQCSVNGTNELVPFQWLKDSQNELRTTPEMFIFINENSSITQLQFRPLSQRSHNGSYCCSAMLDGIRQSKCFSVVAEGIHD